MTKHALSNELHVHPSRISRLLSGKDRPGRLFANAIHEWSKPIGVPVESEHWDEAALPAELAEIDRLRDTRPASTLAVAG